MTETMSRKRVVLRIQLTTRAKADLTELGDRLGVPQNRIMTRLLEWFCDQHAAIRNFVLGLVPNDMRRQTAQWAISNINK